MAAFSTAFVADSDSSDLDSLIEDAEICKNFDDFVYLSTNENGDDPIFHSSEW